MDAYLIIGNNVDLSMYDFKDNLVVGVDKGAFLAYLNNIRLDYAVGDFDSISAEELKLLEKYTKVIKLNPIKDLTDTEYALEMFKECNHIFVLGGIFGRRIDHFFANLKLFYKYPNLILVDNNTHISLCDMMQGFTKDEYTYYSFFALEDVYDLTLSGFKYELTNFNLSHESSLGVSNEIINLKANLSFSKGKLLLIKTKNERD